MTEPTATGRPAAYAPAEGPLTLEARSLRSRLRNIRALADGLDALTDAEALVALQRISPLVDHIASHGLAEEHVVFPYMTGLCPGEVAALRADHERLQDLGGALAGWHPSGGRSELQGLLQAFADVADAHLTVEGEACMTVVHAHVVGGAEQQLFEAVECDAFDRAAGAVPETPSR